MTHEPGILDVLRFYYHVPGEVWRALTADRTAFVIMVVVLLGAITMWVGSSADRQQRGKKG
jgi:hypothetical protein